MSEVSAVYSHFHVCAGLTKIKSDTDMDIMFKSKIFNLQRAQTKKLKEKKGIAKYLAESDSDSNDSLNDDDDDKDDLTGGQYLGAKSVMQQEDHPSKLIDLELLNVLKFCGEL